MLVLIIVLRKKLKAEPEAVPKQITAKHCPTQVTALVWEV